MGVEKSKAISRSAVLSSRCSHPEEKKRGTQPCLGKPVRKIGFWPSFLALEHKLNPEILPPPAGKSRSALLCPPAALVVGANCFDFLIPPEFSLHSRRLLPKLQLRPCLLDSGS
ncbi:hypothetical protein SLEP1_g26382 [Rubroshorea leprosula]|nr:hypothetical protein SLEP1_g26382 [Rubroshorea leprosula]